MSSAIEVVMTGDEAKLWRSFQKIIAGQKTMEDGFGKVAKKADEATRSVDKMGKNNSLSDAVQQVDLYAAGFAHVSQVVQVVSGAMNQLKTNTTEAIDVIRRLKNERKETAQLSTDHNDYQYLSESSKRVAARYGLSLEESTKLTNAARAGGFDRSLDQVALATATFAPADDLIPTAASLPTLFEGLTTDQALNLTAASGTSAKNMTFSGVAEQLRIGAQGAAPAGSSAVEAAAMATVLSDLFGKSTGDRMRAFGSKVAMDPKLRGKGIMGAYDMMVADPKLRAGFLKDSQELHAVFNKMSAGAAGDVRAMEKTLGGQMSLSGTDKSPLMVGAKSFLEDPTNRALFNADVAEQQRIIAEVEKLGPVGLQAESDISRIRKNMINNNVDPITQFLLGAAMNADVTVFDPLTGVKSGWRTQGDPGSDRATDAASKAIGGLEKAAETLNSAARNLERQSESYSRAQRAEASIGGGER